MRVTRVEHTQVRAQYACNPLVEYFKFDFKDWTRFQKSAQFKLIRKQDKIARAQTFF